MTEACIFRGTEAYALQNEHLRVVLLKYGGKVASIQKNGREYISQGQSKEFIVPEFEANFGEYDLSGFDDMVPTVNAGYIQDGVFAGVRMADHGEIWALRWRVTTEVNEIRAEVDGVRLPYSLSKRLSLQGNTLSIQYELWNKTEIPFPCLWAAHMLINANENTRFVPAGAGNAIRSTLDMFSRLNGFGAVHSWPETKDRKGNPYYLDRLLPRNAGTCEKYYFEGACGAGELRVTDPDMILRFDPAVTPYLGIWLNSDGYKGQYNIGIEPATAPLDSPENARQWGYAAELKGQELIKWHLEIELP
jgi:galactose mutarotase-like enzyme